MAIEMTVGTLADAFRMLENDGSAQNDKQIAYVDSGNGFKYVFHQFAVITEGGVDTNVTAYACVRVGNVMLTNGTAPVVTATSTTSAEAAYNKLSVVEPV